MYDNIIFFIANVITKRKTIKLTAFDQNIISEIWQLRAPIYDLEPWQEGQSAKGGGKFGEMKETTTPSWLPHQNRKSWTVHPNVGPIKTRKSLTQAQKTEFVKFS